MEALVSGRCGSAFLAAAAAASPHATTPTGAAPDPAPAAAAAAAPAAVTAAAGIHRAVILSLRARLASPSSPPAIPPLLFLAVTPLYPHDP
jgi:hypothetical protein